MIEVNGEGEIVEDDIEGRERDRKYCAKSVSEVKERWRGCSDSTANIILCVAKYSVRQYLKSTADVVSL